MAIGLLFNYTDPLRLLTMRTKAGYFFMKKKFEKRALSVEEQITLLRDKGLIINDINQATHFLSAVGYYRLSRYFQLFLNYSHSNKDSYFNKSLTFERIYGIYLFDSKLKMLVLEVIEKIEIALRASLTNVLAVKYGATWYTEENLFNKAWKRKNKSGFAQSEKLAQEIKKITNGSKKEDFIKRYNEEYYPNTPPSWMILECLSFGSISAVFRYLLKKSDKKQVSKVFEESPTVLDSWFESVRYIRNLCAHHSRLWNRWFVIEPIQSKSVKYIKTKERTFHQQAIILNKLNKKLCPDTTWHYRLFELFSEYSDYVPFEQMGFAKEWQKDSFWNI